MSIQGFTAAFDDPEHGWIAVLLEDGDRRYQFVPSHVPHDSIAMLASALLSVLEGRDAVVQWNDEPAVHEFHFTVSAQGAALAVVVVHPRAHSVVEREPVFSVHGSREAVVTPLWRALRNLEARFSSAEYHRRWREPFPVAEVAELGRRLRTARSEHP